MHSINSRGRQSATDLPIASLKLVTGPLQKKKPNMPEIDEPQTSWPAALPASRMPLISWGARAVRSK